MKKSTEKSTSFGAKQIATVGALLAICLVSQIFKSLSIFITGPIINLCLVLCVVLVNLPCAIALSVITPITAYFIAPSPVMQIVPWILIFIIGGNAILCVATHFLVKKDVLTAKGFVKNVLTYLKAILCAALKGAFMGITISLWLLPTFIPAESKIYAKLSTFQFMFSVAQFITALIGFVYFFIIVIPLKKVLKNG